MPPEPTIETTPDPPEIDVLRRVNAELNARHARDKALITAHETSQAALTAKLTEANSTIRDITIGVPLKAMAESISTIPDLFLEQFGKHFKLESIKGELTLQTLDGKPALDKNGKAIPFEQKALTELLTTGDDPRAKTFQAITIASKASGASNSNGTQNGKSAPAARRAGLQFGLR